MLPATEQTLSGLNGQVFRKQAVINLTPKLTLIRKNLDGTGQSGEQLCKTQLDNVLSYGRGGVFADYPTVPEGQQVTAYDLDTGNIRPKLIGYSPFAIINWRSKEIGAQSVLSLVVLKEKHITADDGFSADCETQFRVLRLEATQPNSLEHFYKVEIWRKDAGGDSYSIAEEFIPLDSTSRRFDFIPFKFIGWKDNTPECDAPPLLKLATLNRHHYMVSADYYESVFIVGQPTPVFAGLTKEWAKDVFGNRSIQLGSRAAVPLPVGGSAELLTVPADSIAADKAMEKLESQMKAIGAQLIMDKEVQVTATENRNDTAMSISVLASSANNVSEAVTWGLRVCGMFVGECERSKLDEENSGTKTPDIYCELNTDFDLSMMTAQDRAQLMAEWKSQAITTKEMRYAMTAAGIAYEDFDDYQSSIEADISLFPDASTVDPKTGLPIDPNKDKQPAQQKKEDNQPVE